jgi:hypothetical protein
MSFTFDQDSVSCNLGDIEKEFENHPDWICQNYSWKEKDLSFKPEVTSGMHELLKTESELAVTAAALEATLDRLTAVIARRSVFLRKRKFETVSVPPTNSNSEVICIHALDGECVDPDCRFLHPDVI